MNRRGFLGAVIGVPLAAAVTSAAPAPAVAGTMKLEMLGLHGWIPVDQPASAFFGIDRSVLTGEQLAEFTARYSQPLDWRDVFADRYEP